MSNVNLESLEPVTTLRGAPLNGAPSSADYNDTVRESLADLATLYDFLNGTVIPFLNSLPAIAIGPPLVGLEGRTLYSDTSDTSPLFYNAGQSSALTLADSLRLLNSSISAHSQQLTDLGVNVSALQARLASTNQNDIALALQNMTGTLNNLTAQLNSQQSQISAVQGYLSNGQKVRVSTSPGIPAGGTEVVAVTWAVPFTTNPTSYVVNYAMEDDSGFLEITSFSYISDGSGIYIRVLNTDNAGVHSGFVHATGLGPTTWS